MYEALEMHVRGLIEDKMPIPESDAFAEYMALWELAWLKPISRGRFA